MTILIDFLVLAFSKDNNLILPIFVFEKGEEHSNAELSEIRNAVGH